MKAFEFDARLIERHALFLRSLPTLKSTIKKQV